MDNSKLIVPTSLEKLNVIKNEVQRVREVNKFIKEEMLKTMQFLKTIKTS
jgi:hypothetical protein